MKKWILKAILQKAISFLPYKHQINFFFQKYITKGVNLGDDYFYDRLGHAQKHIESFYKYSKSQSLHTTLELGTGWYPVVPISFFLSGATQVYSLDIVLLTDKEKTLTAIRKILEAAEKGKLKAYINYDEGRLQLLKDILAQEKALSFQEILKKINLEYLVQDARKISLPAHSISLINSNNTFEHIYPFLLVDILKEFKRILAHTGVMSHFIDMSDHFAHLDKTISIYNFLKFTEAEWQWIDNTVQPLNRLRISQYRDIYKEVNIPVSEEISRPGKPEELATIKLAPPFDAMKKEDVAVSHSYFVSVGD
ncbi:MAG: class I SAM-dependent methyltransferase [Bacteroidetes bacterium]|nr:class I SAM-dependent methyltransferase [Bacteroidota bacterium]